MSREEFLHLTLEAEPTLFHISFSILHHEQDCADAVQEAILKAYEQRGSLRKKEYFKIWLIRIVMNECYAILRKKKRYQGFDEELLLNDESLRDYVQEEYIDLYCAIAKLEEKEQLCVLLFYMEDYSVNEIATILKIPAGTVKSRLSRARRNLKGLLGGSEDIC